MILKQNLKKSVSSSFLSLIPGLNVKFIPCLFQISHLLWKGFMHQFQNYLNFTLIWKSKIVLKHQLRCIINKTINNRLKSNWKNMVAAFFLIHLKSFMIDNAQILKKFMPKVVDFFSIRFELLTLPVTVECRISLIFFVNKNKLKKTCRYKGWSFTF